MKGLLLKDIYMAAKYCRAFLLLVVIFLAVSFAGEGNTFFSVYPSFFAGTLPVTLISYDERERWNVYSGTLPYSKAQIVSSKYLIGLFTGITVFLASALVQALRMLNADAFILNEYLLYIATIFSLGIIAPSLILPFIFRYGAEKGRIAYYIMIGMICAIATIMVKSSNGDTGLLPAGLSSAWSFAAVIIGAILIYAVSWYLSVTLYKKREL